MKITQLRNATILLEFESSNQSVAVLVDPMLAPQHALPSLKWLTGSRRRNPLVELPANSESILERVTHGLITHCQRGHFDHLDRAGKHFFRERKIPVICTPHDQPYLARRKIVTLPLQGEERQPFFHGYITPIRCVHGLGLVGRLMEHGHGYFVELPGEPSLYIAGDTILSTRVRHCLTELKPDVSVLPAGGARLDVGGDIIMNADDIALALSLTPGTVIANHLEALDHCPVTRLEVAQAARRAGVEHRLIVPADGQTVECLPEGCFIRLPLTATAHPGAGKVG